MKRIEGVESVDVSLDEGSATVRLAPGNHVTLDQVREVVRKNGFTPRATSVRVAGKVIERNGKPALEVGGLPLVLLLSGDKAADAPAPHSGKTVVLIGTVSEEDSRKEPVTLHVDSVEAARSRR